MTDENTPNRRLSRRSILKQSAALGVAGTGLAALGSPAAASEPEWTGSKTFNNPQLRYDNSVAQIQNATLTLHKVTDDGKASYTLEGSFRAKQGPNAGETTTFSQTVEDQQIQDVRAAGSKNQGAAAFGAGSMQTCEILFLLLGPITLRLLGLTLTVDVIRLRLTADEDSLLGNILCELA